MVVLQGAKFIDVFRIAEVGRDFCMLSSPTHDSSLSGYGNSRQAGSNGLLYKCNRNISSVWE